MAYRRPDLAAAASTARTTSLLSRPAALSFPHVHLPVAKISRRTGELLAESGQSSYAWRVQIEFILKPAKRSSADGVLVLNGRQIPMSLRRNPRARRYVLRLRPGGSATVTVPRGGSVIEARRFAERNKDWLERQLLRLAAQPTCSTGWLLGMEILFRGEPLKIEAGGNGESGMIRFGSEVVRVINPEADLRPAIERHLWSLAAKELPSIALEYAALHQLPIRRITVRNQRSRWGSCSRRGTISLNWRLIQTPDYVRDYIVVHEIMHLKEMNHSSRFWREVKHACPDYEVAEQWLKRHSSLLK